MFAYQSDDEPDVLAESEADYHYFQQKQEMPEKAPEPIPENLGFKHSGPLPAGG